MLWVMLVSAAPRRNIQIRVDSDLYSWPDTVRVGAFDCLFEVLVLMRSVSIALLMVFRTLVVWTRLGSCVS